MKLKVKKKVTICLVENLNTYMVYVEKILKTEDKNML